LSTAAITNALKTLISQQYKNDKSIERKRTASTPMASKWSPQGMK